MSTRRAFVCSLNKQDNAERSVVIAHKKLGNTNRWLCAALMLGRRLRRRPIIAKWNQIIMII